MSGKKCYVCQHSERQRIDEAIIAGQPYLRVAKNFNVSRDSVRRRSKHVVALVKRYDTTQELALARSLKAKIQLREADLLRFQQNAEAKGDIPTAISAMRKLRGYYEFQAKCAAGNPSFAHAQWNPDVGLVLLALCPSYST
jgi:hypothetical protein